MCVFLTQPAPLAAPQQTTTLTPLQTVSHGEAAQAVLQQIQASSGGAGPSEAIPAIQQIYLITDPAQVEALKVQNVSLIGKVFVHIHACCMFNRCVTHSLYCI